MDTARLYDIYRQFPVISTDSRKIAQDSIFFALKGANFDGNSFAAGALASGAAYAVVDEAAVAVDDHFILVPDALLALQQLANYHRRQFSVPFIAITGSNGKTTTKELVAAVLGTRYSTYATEGNLNNHIGVPLTLLKIKPDAEMVVVEMGANHQREIAGYCVIAEPTHAIITNCGKAHIEGFGGEEGVRKGKGELYDFIRSRGGIVFRNTTLPYLEEMAAGIGNQVTYGTENATYIGTPVMRDLFLSVDVPGMGVVNTQLVGIYNYANVMTAIAVGLHFNVPFEEIKNAIERYSPDNSRSQMMKKGSNTIILDAYNANPTSMRAAILNFHSSELAGKTLWVGGMREMGDAEHQEHLELLTLIQSMLWESVILVGNEFRGLQHGYQWFATSAEAADHVRMHKPENSSILIKGSRGSKMETMLDAL